MVQLSHLYLTTGKAITLPIWTFVSKVMSLLFNILSWFVIVFHPRSKHFLISWLKSLSAVILNPKKIKPDSYIEPSIAMLCMPPRPLFTFSSHRHLSNTLASWFPILFLGLHTSSSVCALNHV